MSDKRVEDLSVIELERLLASKRQRQQRQRLERLRAEGRLPAAPAGFQAETPRRRPASAPAAAKSKWRRLGDRLLLLIEIGAVVGLVAVFYNVWQTNRELNAELDALRRQEVAQAGLAAAAQPFIDVVVLPSGHQPPAEGQPPQPGEAGYIPEHLRPAINSYVPPPAPTPGPEQARRIQIPAIDVDHPVVQGDDWEQLKKGVGQHIGSAHPDSAGNMVLSAHNDIYGEIFRHLDQLAPGDEFVIATDRQSYTYQVTRVEIVNPTDVWVMAPTEHASATLISCYPYRVNTRRIVVFADQVAAVARS